MQNGSIKQMFIRSKAVGNQRGCIEKSEEYMGSYKAHASMIE
jgi:hypothetical protein